jgi:hypothetical protein
LRPALVLVGAVAFALWSISTALSPPAFAVSDRLPDLGMAKLKDLQVERADGRRLLRFSSMVVNIGEGPFELHGSRPDAETPTMTTVQRVFDDVGGHREAPTEAIMYFGGDGHNHWHVQDLESFELERIRGGKRVGTGAKHGFCFFDNQPFGSTQAAFYAGCGLATDLGVTMGLSPGWGDLYRYTLPDQYIDITGLPRGRYRLQATADEPNWFLETNESNNATWVNLHLKGGKVRVLKHGPRAQPSP